MHENAAVIMEQVMRDHPDIAEDKRILLYTYIRLAHSFPNYEKRKLFVQTRLQSLSILVYSGAIQEHANNLLYDGLIEELVDVLTVNVPPLPEIKVSCTIASKPGGGSDCTKSALFIGRLAQDTHSHHPPGEDA